MNLHASPCDKNGQVNQGVTGTFMQFRNWKRLLRSSVDHYGKYRFARLRIVSLQDYKSSDPYETGPTNPSWSEEGMYMHCALSPLSVSVVGAKPLRSFIKSRHECRASWKSEGTSVRQMWRDTTPALSRYPQAAIWVSRTDLPSSATRREVPRWKSATLRSASFIERQSVTEFYPSPFDLWSIE
jgi:hypothetical protein